MSEHKNTAPIVLHDHPRSIEGTLVALEKLPRDMLHPVVWHNGNWERRAALSLADVLSAPAATKEEIQKVGAYQLNDGSAPEASEISLQDFQVIHDRATHFTEAMRGPFPKEEPFLSALIAGVVTGFVPSLFLDLWGIHYENVYNVLAWGGFISAVLTYLWTANNRRVWYKAYGRELQALLKEKQR